jgi:ferrous iron transport protein B
MSIKHLDIAIVGNPNVGKSSLVNALAGTRLYVGNWPGVTVEKKQAAISYKDTTFNLVDLPGMYSLHSYTQEETIARDYLLHDVPDIIVQVIDSTNLERNLYLTTQLMELNIPLVVALNMSDEAQKQQLIIDCQAFHAALNIRAIATVATKKKGLNELLDCVYQLHSQPPSGQLRATLAYDQEIQVAAKEVSGIAEQHFPLVANKYPTTWLAFKLLEQNQQLIEREDLTAKLAEIKLITARLEDKYQDDIVSILTTARYQQAKNIVNKVSSQNKAPAVTLTDRLDKILLHKYLGIPIFILLMWLIFKLTFDLSIPFVNWIDGLFSGAIPKWASVLLTYISAPPWLLSLVTSGIIAGVGFVLTFVPIIFVMMFFLTLLEATGYMARVAFIMDRLMHTMGLHGKSFVALLLGFGCNVPSIYATRTLESHKDRILTALIAPLMSCSARLPVYILFIAAFFPNNSSLLLLGLYLLGIVLAVLMGMLFKKILFKASVPLFIMELPPYRFPTMKNLSIHTWNKGKHFLVKAGTYILAVSIFVWFFLNMPWGVQHKQDSYLGQTGQLIAPALEPLGFGSWEAAAALITGVVAKEIVVSTMAEIYTPDVVPALAEDSSLSQDLLEAASSFLAAGSGAISNVFSNLGVSSISTEPDTNSASLKNIIYQQFTPLSALSFMVFVLLYMPCVVTGIAMKQEFGTWKWYWLTVVYGLILAWSCSFLVFQIGQLFIY